jgi:hypothetical protein
MQSTLDRSDYVNFLVRMKFGKDDPLSACSREAYKDFQRTLRGVGKADVFPQATKARQRANEALIQMIIFIRDVNVVAEKDFDDWHRKACARLAATYRDLGYPSFRVGHAQKWLNMTFKYIYTMGEQRLPGFDHLYGFCHVPLDNILTDALRRYDFPPLPCKWSKLADYDTYLDRQLWVRKRFPLAPLDVEFRLWMGSELPTN